MLADVFVVSWTQVTTHVNHMDGVEGQGIEFMVTHHGQCSPFLDHWPHDIKDLSNLWATVDEVAEKDYLSFGMAVRTIGLPIAEGIQQLHKFIGMAVNIADKIVHIVLPSSMARWHSFPFSKHRGGQGVDIEFVAEVVLRQLRKK